LEPTVISLKLFTFSSVRSNGILSACESLFYWIFNTSKQKICWAPRKFGVCSNRPKTVLPTDLAVALTHKSVITTDFVRCLTLKLIYNHSTIISAMNAFRCRKVSLVCYPALSGTIPMKWPKYIVFLSTGQPCPLIKLWNCSTTKMLIGTFAVLP
jgi:hypothetical protein